MGRDSDADTLIEEALHCREPMGASVHLHDAPDACRKKDRATTVALFNRQQHPEERFWTFLGLARVYTAAGDKKNAIANWEQVLHNIPPTWLAGKRALKTH